VVVGAKHDMDPLKLHQSTVMVPYQPTFFLDTYAILASLRKTKRLADILNRFNGRIRRR
jgi:hypothetical protein